MLTLIRLQCRRCNATISAVVDSRGRRARAARLCSECYPKFMEAGTHKFVGKEELQKLAIV